MYDHVGPCLTCKHISPVHRGATPRSDGAHRPSQSMLERPDVLDTF